MQLIKFSLFCLPYNAVPGPPNSGIEWVLLVVIDSLSSGDPQGCKQKSEMIIFFLENGHGNVIGGNVDEELRCKRLI